MGDNHSLFYGNMNLGILFLEIDHSNESLQYLDSALQIAEKSGEAVSIARVWNNIGSVYLKLHHFKLAEQYFVKAQSLFLQVGDNSELAKTHYNLGLTYQHLEQSQDAINHLETALSLFQASQNSIDAMKTLVALVGLSLHPIYSFIAERHRKALTTLVAQQKVSEFQSAFQDIVAQYCSSFPDTNISKLLQLVAT